MSSFQSLLFLTLLLISKQSLAQPDAFHAGKIIPDFGKVAQLEGMQALPENVSFKVSFDVAKQAEVGTVNRSLDSVARFINMHADAGIDLKQINLAVVIHGNAVNDMIKTQAYQSMLKNKSLPTATLNANVTLIKTLQKHGVVFFVCGQSAAYYGVKTRDLLPGVKMSLSAMTAHALLQQQGFTLNPF